VYDATQVQTEFPFSDVPRVMARRIKAGTPRLRGRAFPSSSMTTRPDDIRLDHRGLSPCAVSIFAKAAETQRGQAAMRRRPQRTRTVRGAEKVMVRYEYANNAR